MSRWTEIALLTGLFVLRLGIPLAVTFLIAWWLKQMDRRWQAEAATEAQRTPAPAAPVARQQAAPADAGAQAFPLRVPCWILRNCPEERKRTCPACLDQSLPCWMVRLRAERQLPRTCPGCEIFRKRIPLQPTGA